MKRIILVAIFIILTFYNCQAATKKIDVSSLKLNHSAYNLLLNEQVTLKVVITPTNATNKTIIWSSSNKNIASVSNGVVTAKKEGVAIITAKTSNHKVAKCIINVRKGMNAIGVKFVKDSFNNLKHQALLARFTENFIRKGILEHQDKNNFPLLAYRQMERNKAFFNKLNYLSKDYTNKISVNQYKWTFDCASFVAYIYNTFYGFSLYNDISTKSPYLVRNFASTTQSPMFKIIHKGSYKSISLTMIDYSIKPGDLFIAYGSHIGIYLGNRNLAEFTPRAISLKYKNTYYDFNDQKNLGAHIDIATNFLGVNSDYQIGILRLKDDSVNLKNLNTVIKWPDTGKYEDLVLNKSDILASKTIKVNQKAKLNIYHSPMNALNANKTILTSSNSKVVTVDNKGNIKGIKRGTATITAKTSNGKTASIKITVK